VFNLHRFFVAPEKIQGQVAIIDKEEARHIQRVLRLKAGDKVILFDGSGYEYQALLLEEGTDGLAAQIIERSNQEQMPVSLCLVQGIAKGDKMDNIIQKASEIGVAEIYPLDSERTVVRLQGDNSVKKLKRWQHIAREACKQCRRNLIPEIKPVVGMEDLLEEIGEAPALLFYEKEENNRLRQVLSNIKAEVLAKGRLFLIIGPEGGFSETEVERVLKQGVKTASLGARILRTETAGLVASAIIMYEYDLAEK
jgi:16S rRNA (uracil1498-N3)-methyltransferase